MKEPFEFKAASTGEWTVEASESNSISIMSNDYEIARVEDNETFLLTEQDWKNAYLISAAPELLQAAIDFVNKVDEGRAKSTDSYKKFKEAINKALGNEQ